MAAAAAAGDDPPGNLQEEYADAKEFTAAVHMLAVTQNKTVSTATWASGSKTRTMVCTHHICARKKFEDAVRKRAADKYPGDTEQQKDMVKKNLGMWKPGESVCAFKAQACKNRQTGRWKLTTTCVLRHSAACTVAGAKVKASALQQNPAFRASVIANGGKGKAKALRAEAQKLGFGGAALTNDAIYRAQSKVRDLFDLVDDASDDIVDVKPPPKRVKEAHGNSRRKRKERGSSASTGRTRSASFAAAAAAATGSKAPRLGFCALCTSAGRTDLEHHKSSMCPYKAPDVDPSNFLTLSDEDDDISSRATGLMQE
eukprot:m.360043 g.360043  ORF g.360043 m.360043 type:complete len:314 (+) comp16634_c2_seq12:60-1001(+)